MMSLLILLLLVCFVVLQVEAAHNDEDDAATFLQVRLTLTPSMCQGTTTNSSLTGCHQFDGIGAISGGGATTRLLVEYPTDAQQQILDILFRPNFGASLQVLKVEMGGDSYSTDGSESSHMHSRDDLNWHRGYEWWLLQQAKQRNPEISTYVLPWAFPGWLLDPGDDPTNPFQHLDRITNYTLQWVVGAQAEHNITMDYVGLWNEAGTSKDYLLALRKILNDHGFSHIQLVSNDGEAYDVCLALAQDNDYAQQVNIMGFHYPDDAPDKHNSIPPSCHYVSSQYNIPIWASEESSSYDDFNGAACWARVLAAHYVHNNITSALMWNLIGSYMHGTNWYASSMLTADQPWSGYYGASDAQMPVVWATAHYTQFIPRGWWLLKQQGASGELAHGGYYLTAVSPCVHYFTVVVVKISRDHAECTRPPLWDWETQSELVDLRLTLPLFNNNNHALQVWYSNFEPQTEEEEEEAILFQKLNVPRASKTTDLLTPSWWTTSNTSNNNDMITIHVGINVTIGSVWTITNQGPHVGRKGSFPNKPTPPQSQPQFPLPYFDNFQTQYNGTNCYAKYLSDQMGAFELQYVDGDEQELNNNNSSRPVALVQMAPQRPVGWFDSGGPPITLIGMTEWEDIGVEASIKLPNSNGVSACVATRTDQWWSRGVSLCVNTTTWQVSYGGPHQHQPIATGALPANFVTPQTWHNLSLTTVGNQIMEASVSSSDHHIKILGHGRPATKLHVLEPNSTIRIGDSGFVALGATDFAAVQFGHLHIFSAAKSWSHKDMVDIVPTMNQVQYSVVLKPCTPNGYSFGSQQFTMTSQWHIRHIPTGLCVAAELPTVKKGDGDSYPALTLHPCQHDAPSQRFKHRYTQIRNGVMVSISNPQGDLCATRDGRVSLLVGPPNNNNLTSGSPSCAGESKSRSFTLWSYYPNTNQLRNSFGYADWLEGRAQCLHAGAHEPVVKWTTGIA